MSDSILMVMESESCYRDKKTNEQERKKLLIRNNFPH